MTGYAFRQGTVVEYWGFPGLAPGAGLEGNGGVVLLLQILRQPRPRRRGDGAGVEPLEIGFETRVNFG